MTSFLFAVSVTVVVLIWKVKSFCSPLTGVAIVITLLSIYIKLTRTLKVERNTLLKSKEKRLCSGRGGILLGSRLGTWYRGPNYGSNDQGKKNLETVLRSRWSIAFCLRENQKFVWKQLLASFRFFSWLKKCFHGHFFSFFTHTHNFLQAVCQNLVRVGSVQV